MDIDLGIGRDVTELKRTAYELQKSLAEKDNLMKELNHRVKNNLLMVTSLISLKESALEGPADLSDLRNQIDAIRIDLRCKPHPEFTIRYPAE
jgi:two-component sensor histidine kinase